MSLGVDCVSREVCKEDHRPHLASTLPFPPTEPPPKPPRYVRRTYWWMYRGRVYRVELIINLADYDYYRERKEQIIREMGKDGLTDIHDYCYYYPRMAVVDKYVRELASKIYKLSPHKYGAELVNFVASFVQNIYYNEIGEIIIIDGVIYRDNPKYPLETLIEGGDCEDKSILAALLKALRFNVALILFEKSDHVMNGSLLISLKAANPH